MREVGRTDWGQTQTISAIQLGIALFARGSGSIFSLDAMSPTVFALMKNPYGSPRGQRQTFFLLVMRFACVLRAGFLLEVAAESFALPIIQMPRFTAEH